MEFFLPLSAFNVGSDTKNGCGVFQNKNVQTSSTYFCLFLDNHECQKLLPQKPCTPEVFPQNSQVAQHFNEFLRGYRISAESVEVRFPHVDGTRNIHANSVGISDGFGKVILMVGICVIAYKLESNLHSVSNCICFAGLDMGISQNLFPPLSDRFGTTKTYLEGVPVNKNV